MSTTDELGLAKPPRRGRPIVVDFFAGAGGLSLGFEQAGFDVVAAADIDPVHCAVHHYNFPQTKTICKSVVDLSGNQLRKIAMLGPTDIDVVCGGAPCQGFSTIGKRALDDPRNQLVFHFCRLVGELRPKYVVFENVRGLTLGQHKTFLEEIIESMQNLGYAVVLPYRVLNAVDFEVPQDRKRLFLMAARHDQQMPLYPAPIGRTTVGQALSDLPDADTFGELAVRDWAEARLGPRSRYVRRLRNELPDLTDFSHPRAWDKSIMTSSRRTDHSEVSAQRFATTPVNSIEPISRFLKLAEDGVCNTLRAGTDSARGAFTSPRPIHPIFPRVITVREAARLHSYPDWFRFHTTKWHGFRQIGNSVPPLLARAVASSIMRSLTVAEPVLPTGLLQLGGPELLQMDMSQAARYFGVHRAVIAQRIRKGAARPESSTEDLFSPHLKLESEIA